MLRIGSFLALLLVCFLAGCGPAEVKPPPTADVKGNVKLNGQPMASGEIIFAVEGQPSQTIAIANGAYAGKANVGKNQVKIFFLQRGTAAFHRSRQEAHQREHCG